MKFEQSLKDTVTVISSFCTPASTYESQQDRSIRVKNVNETLPSHNTSQHGSLYRRLNNH